MIYIQCIRLPWLSATRHFKKHKKQQQAGWDDVPLRRTSQCPQAPG